MKKLAWITLVAGYVVLTTAPENASDTRMTIAMILFAIAFTAGLQVWKTEFRNKN